MQDTYTATPIGIVHCSLKTREEATQAKLSDTTAEIELFEQYEEGLEGIDSCAHLVVVCWMHQSCFRSLKVRPLHRPEKLCGVFATKHPDRPNPLGVTFVRLVQRDGNLLRVRGMDVIDETPVLDIKPYTEMDRLACD